MQTKQKIQGNKECAQIQNWAKNFENSRASWHIIIFLGHRKMLSHCCSYPTEYRYSFSPYRLHRKHKQACSYLPAPEIWPSWNICPRAFTVSNSVTHPHKGRFSCPAHGKPQVGRLCQCFITNRIKLHLSYV